MWVCMYAVKKICITCCRIANGYNAANLIYISTATGQIPILQCASVLQQLCWNLRWTDDDICNSGLSKSVLSPKKLGYA